MSGQGIADVLRELSDLRLREQTSEVMGRVPMRRLVNIGIQFVSASSTSWVGNGPMQLPTRPF